MKNPGTSTSVRKLAMILVLEVLCLFLILGSIFSEGDTLILLAILIQLQINGLKQDDK